MSKRMKQRLQRAMRRPRTIAPGVAVQRIDPRKMIRIGKNVQALLASRPQVAIGGIMLPRVYLRCLPLLQTHRDYLCQKEELLRGRAD